MHFFATIDPISAIHRNWRDTNRVSGLLEHVLFRWDGRVYVSGELQQEEIDKFRVRQDRAVQLELISVPPDLLRQVVPLAKERQEKSEPKRQVDNPAPKRPARPRRKLSN